MTLNTVCQFCNDTGVTPEKTICTRCSTFARLPQETRDARLTDDISDTPDEPFVPNFPLTNQRARAKLLRNAGALITGLALIAAVTSASVNAAPANTPNVPPTGCAIVASWEDGSAIASCAEDGARYVYDADGNTPPAHVGDTGPRWDIGWYVCVDTLCQSVDHTQPVADAPPA